MAVSVIAHRRQWMVWTRGNGSNVASATLAGTRMNMIVTYLCRCAVLTCQQLLILFGPLLLLASSLQLVSRHVRNRAAGIFGADIYIWLTAPGTMIHELGHAFFCLVFGHKIVAIKLFAPNDQTLGYVRHSFNNRSLYQRIGNFFIGTGPIWFGSVIVVLLLRLLLGVPLANQGATPTDTLQSTHGLIVLALDVTAASWQAFVGLISTAHISSWRFCVFAYLVICIGSHITLSLADLQNAWQGLLALILTLATVNLATLWLARQTSLAVCQWLVQASVLLYAALLLVICLNGVLAIAVGFISRGR